MGNTERLSSLNGLRQMPKEQEEESAINLKVPKNDDKKVPGGQPSVKSEHLYCIIVTFIIPNILFRNKMESLGRVQRKVIQKRVQKAMPSPKRTTLIISKTESQTWRITRVY